MNEQTVDAMLGRQGDTVDPKTGSPPSATLVQSLANGAAWGWEVGVPRPVSQRFKVPHRNSIFSCVGIE